MTWVLGDQWRGNRQLNACLDPPVTVQANDQLPDGLLRGDAFDKARAVIEDCRDSITLVKAPRSISARTVSARCCLDGSPLSCAEERV